MDNESTKIVYERIYKIEPEYVSKIFGYIMLNTNEHDMIRLAFSPDGLIQCVINKAKSDLAIPEMGAAPVPIPYPSVSSSCLFLPQPYSEFALQNRMQFLSLEDTLDGANPEYSSNFGYYPYPVRGNRRSEFPVKVCHYFSKGYCKHGNKCRYFHGQVMGECGNEEQHVVLRGRALEKLEMEIVELLKSRRGFPISIAALPMVYYEKYGRSLQADGYLTESQRHGKAGFSLTKLLANLNCICVLDRPHGQHSVILAEDAPNYIEFSEHSARQIYLTFPAESTFTEQDVSNYFNKYGPVQDVRIPCQQSRMYGFVTFVYVETVKQILSTTSTHFVCGAQVLVKPYKEKSKLSDRKNIEKSPHPVYYIQNYMEGDLEPQCVPRVCNGSRLMMRKHFIDEDEQQQQHSEFLLTSKNTSHLPYFGFSTKKLAHSAANAEMKEFSSSTEQLHDFLDSWTDHHDDSTEGHNLPDSPFASPIRR